jgi:hypothetical protein
MNSTPALSIAILILAPVSVRPRSGPSCASSRFIVGTETPASDANCSCDHASSARAALTWRIDTFSIDFVMLKIYTFRINIRRVSFGLKGESTVPQGHKPSGSDRRHFIGGSDARVIMGDDEQALIRLWREKRGEIEPKDLSSNLVVQLGVVTEDLNRRWYEANTGQVVTEVQRRLRHPVLRWMGATLDGRVQGSEAVFEAKFMLPWSFSEEAALTKYMPQLQHNMWVVASRSAVLSVITGGGKWVEITTHADPLYQHLVITAERKFWRCVENGEPPALFGVDPPRPRIEAVRIVDMTNSNAWGEFADIFIRTWDAHLEHERAKAQLKGLVPDDAQQAIGHGIRGKRSKSGAISFDLLRVEEEDHAAV